MKFFISGIISWLVVLGLVGQSTASGAVTLSSFFTNNMVLQRDMRDPVWGWAKPGQKVTVRFAGHAVTTTTDAQGEWMVRLPTLQASAVNRSLAISSGSQKIVLHDVLVGEVWLCSGQSNMQYPMVGLFHRTNLAAALAHGNRPDIRLCYVPWIESDFAGTPRKQVLAVWLPCTVKNLGGFSAVGYFFGLKLQKKLKVPIGLIEEDWGGTNIQAWTPAQGFFAIPQLKADQTWLRAMAARQARINSMYQKTCAAWRKAAKQAVATGKVVPVHPAKPISAIGAPHAFHYPFSNATFPDPHQNPTTLFNGMVHPLIPYAMRGVIWYQGENNVLTGDHRYYYHLKALIDSWRKLWHEGNFPFYIVQIAPFNYDLWGPNGALEPLVWQAQERAVRRLPNCAIAGTMDIGNINNIHPADKLDVGDRLALIALAKTYGFKNIVYSGPQFASADFIGKKVIIHFRHVDGGLASRNGKPLNWFRVINAAGKSVHARATIVGRTVVVQAPTVATPTAVQFAFSDMAVPNLMNKAGLPALPFVVHRQK
ncbi:MAG: sialate O-acetylesterase [Phycisphaerae bacterium]